MGALLSGLQAKLVALGLGAVAVLAVLIGVYRSGARSERARINEKNLEAKNEQLKAATRRPRTRAQLLDRLRSGNF